MNIGAVMIGLAPTLVALLGASGLISAAETSMTAASRGRMHQLEREGDKAAKRVNMMMADQENMIGAILLSNNVINILATALTTAVLSGMGEYGVAVATAIMTVLIVVFSEILPKTLAIARPDDVARFMSLPTYWVVKIFGPLARAAQFIVRTTLKPFGIQMGMEVDVLAAHEEIRGAVEYHHSEGVVESGDRRMLGGVLDLSEMDVSEVMVHRRQMEFVEADLDPKALIEAVLACGHSRIPLWRDEPENIIGVLHAKDLLAAVARAGGKIAKLDIGAIAREPWFIPDTTKLKDQLNAFLKKRSHFALVVDEYGVLQGLLTLEDILEEIVGEIDDEHDIAVRGVRPQADGNVHVDGNVTIRDLNRAMDWHLPDDEAVTVAGLVIHEAQTIPEPGQIFLFHGHRFQILRRQRNQITALSISPKEQVEEGMNFRRIVTGHDDAGRSILVSDAPSTSRNGSLINFWTTHQTPADIDAPDPLDGVITLHPGPGGVTFRYFQIQPESAFAGVTREQRYADTRARFVAMGAEHALVDTTRHPAMHRTHTVDYIILLEGEVTLLLDEADVPMQPFDVVIQRGTNHAWLNTGPGVATLMAVLIDAN